MSNDSSKKKKSSRGDDTTNETQCYQLSIPIYGQICQISENRDLFGNLDTLLPKELLLSKK